MDRKAMDHKELDATEQVGTRAHALRESWQTGEELLLWTVTCQAPLAMGFPRQEYWSGLPFPIPGDLPDPGIEPISPVLVGMFFTTEP